MPTFPRTIAPSEAGDPELPRGVVNESNSGQRDRRSVGNRGITWEEKWAALEIGDANAEALKTFVKTSAHSEAEFNVVHPGVHGSGLAPNGTGTAGVTVSGADQTGVTLTTTGWPVSTTDVAVTGDYISIAGINHVFIIKDNADSDGSGNATLTIHPSILSGNSPADGAAITTTGVTIRAMVEDYDMPTGKVGVYATGLTVTFKELP